MICTRCALRCGPALRLTDRMSQRVLGFLGGVGDPLKDLPGKWYWYCSWRSSRNSLCNGHGAIVSYLGTRWILGSIQVRTLLSEQQKALYYGVEPPPKPIESLIGEPDGNSQISDIGLTGHIYSSVSKLSQPDKFY